MTRRFADDIPDETVVESSGWFAVQLRYAYLSGEPRAITVELTFCSVKCVYGRGN